MALIKFGITRPNIRVISPKRLVSICRDVRQAERLRVDPDLIELGAINNDDWSFLKPKGENNPVYRASEPESLFSYFDHLVKINANIPKDAVAADLGSGLGVACFSMQALSDPSQKPMFASITGFEGDASLATDANYIALKYGVKNVRFENTNFLSNDVDLTKYNFIYYYWPFWDDKYPYMMRDKLLTTLPGTMIVSAGCPEGDKIFDKENFSFVRFSGIRFEPITFEARIRQ